MARITGGIGTGISGKLEQLVFVQRGGKTYVRMAPDYSNTSWSVKQKMHRERFRKVNAFCRQFRTTVIRTIWKALPGPSSGYAKFLKANMPAFSSNGELADYTRLHFSDGVLPLPFNMKASRVPGTQQVEVSWTNDPLMDFGLGYDKLMIATYDGKQFTVNVDTGLTRKMGQGIIVLPAFEDGKSFLYLYFASADMLRFSPDVCFTL